MKDITEHVREWLLSEKEEEYGRFSAALIPNVNNVLGVRLPKLRKFAKSLVKYDYEPFLDHACTYLEETMLQGMLIGLIKEHANTKLNRIERFLPKIDNWSVCDSFCCGLKFTKDNYELVWNFICPFVKSEQEFEVRFALVMMLNYFINEDYIDDVLKKISNVCHQGYYAKMAAAWALSICYVKFPEKTTETLKNIKDSEIKTKAVRKVCESLQVSKDEKVRVKMLLKKEQLCTE